MPSCAGEKQAKATHQPCAGHHTEHEKSKKDTGKVKLLVDCMGINMQQADTASIDKPNLKSDFAVYIPVSDIVSSQTAPADAGYIRGPPPDWPNLHETQPSLILTTQRLRI